MKAIHLMLLFSLNAPAWDTAQDLLDSARKGDLASVKTVIGNQADLLETKTRYGQTPLFLAAMNGHIHVVQFLLDKGAKVDVTDTFYKATAVGFAASRKHLNVVKLLLARSSDVDRNLDTVTGLRDTELVGTVLAAGKPSQAALNRNFELSSGHAEIAELLRKAGAQPPVPAAAVDAKVLESYSGSYRADGFPLEIKALVKEGKLFLQATGQPEFAPKAKSAKLFEFAPARLEVEFNSPGTFILRQGGQAINFKKVVTP